MSPSRQETLTPFDPRDPAGSRVRPAIGMVFSLGVLALIVGGVIFAYTQRAPARPSGSEIVSNKTVMALTPALPAPKAPVSLQADPPAPAPAKAAPPAPAKPAPQPMPTLRTTPAPVPAVAPATPAPRPTPAPARATPAPPAAGAAAAPRSTPASPIVAKAAPAAPAPVTPAPAPSTPPSSASSSGGAVVQVGAFPTQAEADAGWNAAVRATPSLSSGKGKAVQAIERNGQTLYRSVVTGFDTKSAATAYCSALKAAGGNCFVR